ncbi:YihY/virulence factor BrkB family protein [Mycoplasmopsis caviae]|uniref:Ribonuclease BN-like family n=1 Tax=Mycoplasmopsis caviae TaxID=55603 RepID=A0A3P8LI69_9BACT|nr:YihY/virulence factor BrkB family protein [Mycoplasmopsis caviae]UUD35121.1 YihY/virulence factor BrkB family protein [Mycoplasmopsis caviae]VDR42062.1 Ribonuclease BN-like family [Mycoplasmopsis caviae]
MQKSNNQIKIYTGLDQSKIKKEYRNNLKKSWFARNIAPVDNKRWLFIEKIVKFFLMIILWIATPRLSWKNKSKTNELINRTYKKFTDKSFVFIPLTTAFYFLVSFVPIITIMIILLSLIPSYHTLFINEILGRIIPGVTSIIKIPDTSKKGAQLTSLIILCLASLWMSSSGFGKFIYSQNYIYGHKNLGNWLTNRLKGLLVVLSISIYLFLAGALYLFFYQTFTDSLSIYYKNIYFYITFSIYLLVVLYFGLSLLYTMSPSFKLGWTTVFPGVLITSIPIMIFMTIFGFLTSLIKYDKYGIIGSFMYIALFVSYLTYFMFLGIIVNEAYYKTFVSSYTVSKRSLFGKMFLKI